MSTAREQLFKNLSKKSDLLKVERLRSLDLYQWQQDFIDDKSKSKGLRCGNQQGKTYVGCANDAMDLTGEYPDNYKGHRFNHPIVLVAGCINNDKTRDLLQKELFGDPIEWEAELGTGWIPKRCIGKIQKKRGVPDAFYNVRIKHHTNGKFDGWSKVVFLAYEMGKATWMGHKADVTHLDEEPPEDILEQASRSSIATGGRIRITWTPENGMTKVVKMVQDKWSMHTAEWKDVAGEDFEIEVEGEKFEFKTVHTLKGRKGHLTKEKVLSAQKNILPYQMKMRMRGIPVLGSGLVFAYAEESFKCESKEFPEYFKYIDAIDFGGLSSTAHPTAFVRLAYDPQMDIIYIYDGFRLIGKEIPEIASYIIMKPNSDVIPVIWPHDGNKITGQGESTKDQYLKAGVNMFYNADNPDKSHFTNPPSEDKLEGTGGIQIMPGITEMSTRMSDGRFYVMDSVGDFWEEYRQYHMKDGKIIDIDDDTMSASRQGVQSIRHAVTLIKKHKKINMNPTGNWLS
jgi:phage terminase large subunit-like protein